jgi:ABC-type transport system substrate-binding protein
MPLTRVASAARLTLCALAACAWTGCRDPYPTPRWLGAGATTPRRGGTLRFAYDSDVTTVDPALANDTVAGIPTRLLHEGLVNYGPGSTTLVPALAERWTASPDGLVYTFHLRPTARFSNGRTVVCDDFVYSWERLLNPRRVASPGAENYRLVRGYDAFREGRAAHLAGLSCPTPRTLRVRTLRSRPHLPPRRRDALRVGGAPRGRRGRRRRALRPQPRRRRPLRARALGAQRADGVSPQPLLLGRAAAAPRPRRV